MQPIKQTQSSTQQMAIKNIGFLHPGAMGISVTASAQNAHHRAYWLPEKRSKATIDRASSHKLTPCNSLNELCSTCDIILSICPPHAAVEVAEQVASTKFSGVFVDANAISPHNAQSISQLMNQANIDFVDGGIIGGPP